MCAREVDSKSLDQQGRQTADKVRGEKTQPGLNGPCLVALGRIVGVLIHACCRSLPVKSGSCSGISVLQDNNSKVVGTHRVRLNR